MYAYFSDEYACFTKFESIFTHKTKFLLKTITIGNSWFSIQEYKPSYYIISPS